MPIQMRVTDSERQSLKIRDAFDIPSYPIDMSSFLELPECVFNTEGVPCEGLKGYSPTTVIQFALAHWNHYLTTKEEKHCNIFLAQARWLIENEVLIGDAAGGWPISSPHPNEFTQGSWLSALAQGGGLSVLVRAYWLTGDNVYFDVTNHVIRTFELDILDGGVGALVGEKGIFFEDVAVYPASHKLSSFIFSLFGLYDYVALTGDASIKGLIQCSLVTMHCLLDEFDVGFWTRSNLQPLDLASPAHLALQVQLLEVLAAYSGCDHCKTLAAHWRNYQRHVGSRLRYLVATGWATLCRAFLARIRSALFPTPQSSSPMRICIPVTSFPFTGGILTVLEGIAQVMEDLWNIEYLAQIIGPHAEKYKLHRFGTQKTAPWHFPLVWLHFLVGMRKLVSLLRHGAEYRVLVPQDGLFTAAFSALIGKLAGVRVVCIDHSTLTWPWNRKYRAERAAAIERKKWPWILKLFVLSMLKFYWPSISLLARISAHFVDYFLIPGVPGDEIEEVCKQLGIRNSRLKRFDSMIDIHRHIAFDSETRTSMREKKGIPADAIMVAIICRLAPEKGLDVAMESISQVLSVCSSEVCKRLRVVIAGDGPLREHLVEDIQRRRLNQTCIMLGDVSAEEVISLLGISDIFLYTSVRGACFPMSVLEAMASGCAVIASTEPLSNAHLLAEERGIAVPAGDIEQTSAVLTQLVNDLERCKRMGQLARHYISAQHSPTMFRRTLLRATYWSELDELLTVKVQEEATSTARGAN